MYLCCCTQSHVIPRCDWLVHRARRSLPSDAGASIAHPKPDVHGSMPSSNIRTEHARQRWRNRRHRDIVFNQQLISYLITRNIAKLNN